MLNKIIKLLKINHYIKNLVVFVPLIFSMNFVNIKQCASATLMFIAFCLVSSAVYIFNDLVDKESDKLHPIKRFRPIPSGQISLNVAVCLIILLLSISALLSSYINYYCLFTILAYFLLNVLYSFKLKKIPLIDVTCIAIGFILRILSGCFAISVLPSPLVILMTFFLSNFFTFIKRKLELQLIKNGEIRTSLKEMDIHTINRFILINVILSISFYITYVLDDTTIARVGSNYLYITTIPFALIIYRLLLLVDSTNDEDDPIIYFKQDIVLKCLVVFYFIVFALIFIKF